MNAAEKKVAGRRAAGSRAAAKPAKPATRRASSRSSGRKNSSAVSPALSVGAAVLSVVTVVLGGLAAEPIYLTSQLWWVAVVSGAVVYTLVLLGKRFGWGGFTFVALVVACTVLLVPLAVPSALSGGVRGIIRGLIDGLAAVALGWKQLLTLTLPVGSYQSVLVPLLVVIFVSVAAATSLALRGGRWAPYAAIPMLLPVLFGTVFGASAVSESIAFGPLAVEAPRELALWLGAACAGAIWVAWSSGIARRAALKRGRLSGTEESVNQRHGVGSVRRNAVLRGTLGVLLLGVALLAGFALVPVLDSGSRSVARDAIDPEIVVREQTSPLAGYRVWKRDALFATPIFEVMSRGQLPSRLRIAVLDRYDGVDFSVGDVSAAGRFTRFPSGESLEESSRVRVEIAKGYKGVWVPVAIPLGSPPSFGGDRAGALADSFFVNRELGSAVAVPKVSGLRIGDSYEADMSVEADAKLGSEPASGDPLIDLETMPELERWLRVQQLPASADGLADAITRLRDRGYLSHSLTSAEGEREWLDALASEYGTKFVTSPGGHSIARIEQLFQQLNEQQTAAGEDAKDTMLVAAIGDDEQFAAAAALLARAMGFESRVVLGVRVGDEDSGVPGIPACQEECSGEHVAAWIEARGSDGVWAPLDVTPQVATPPTTLEEGELLPEFPTLPEERDATESDPPIGTSESDGGSSDSSEQDGLTALWPILRIIGLGAATLVLLALLVLFIPFVKRARSRYRRGAAAAEIQALGAWDELINACEDMGARVSPQTATRRELAERLGVESADWVAWTVDRAVFAPESIDHRSALQLWQVVDAEIAARLNTLTPAKRLRARYSLASFGLRFGGQRRTSTRSPASPLVLAKGSGARPIQNANGDPRGKRS